MVKIKLILAVVVVLALIVPAASSNPSVWEKKVEDKLSQIKVTASDTIAGKKPGDKFYWFDEALDNIRIKVYETLRTMRVVSHEKVVSEKEKVLQERKAELNELIKRGQNETHERAYKRYQEMKREFAEYIEPKLEVNYTIDDNQVITITAKNVWDRKINAVTGGAEFVNQDTGKTHEFSSPVPIPVNLKPKETRTYQYDLSGYQKGNWSADVEIQTWTGYELVDNVLYLEL